jgi:hypothetical protein
MDTLFRIATSEVEFEVEGSEDFVRRETRNLLPWIEGRSVNPPPVTSPLLAWYRTNLPRGEAPSMQDCVLLFAYYFKREDEKHLFSPADVKRAFAEVDRRVPKSLLQIMGTLKRDHGLLWSPGDKRGAYALSPEGIRYVEKLLGISGAKDRPEPKAAPPVVEPEDGATGSEHWNRLFKDEGSRRP